MDQGLHVPDLVFLKLSKAASSARPDVALTVEEAHTLTAFTAYMVGLCFHTSIVTTSMTYAY